MKKDLSNKTAFILSMFNNENEDELYYMYSNHSLLGIETDSYEPEGIDKRRKEEKILYLFDEGENITEEEQKMLDSLGQEPVFFFKAKATNFKREYKRMFGEESTLKEDTLDVTGACMHVYYSTKTNYIYFGAVCGGLAGETTYGLINRMTKKGDYAYVYMNQGIAEHTYEEERKDGIKVYYNAVTNPSSDDYYANGKYDILDEEPKYVINKDNHNKFVEYKLTFKKGVDADGNENYYYTTIEKVKK